MPISSTLKSHISNPANRQYLVTLVQITRGSDVYRFGSQLYDTGTAVYHDWLTSSITREAAITTANTVGDFTFVDPLRGNLWRDTEFAGREVVFLLGDVRWAYSSFEVLARQKIDRIVSLGRGEWRAELRETLFEMDAPLTSPQVNSIETPLSAGIVSNADPVPTTSVSRKYHIGYAYPITGHVVRDEGVVLTNYTVNTLGTEITLGANPAGQVTVDFTVTDKTTLPTVIRLLLNNAGVYMSDADVLARMFGTWNTAEKSDFTMSLYIREPRNTTAKQELDRVLADVGWVMRMGDDNLPEFVYLNWLNSYLIPYVVMITEDMVLLGSIEQQDTMPAYEQIRVDYLANQTEQQALAGSVTPANAEYYKQSYHGTLTMAGTIEAEGYTSGTLAIEAGAIGSSATANKVANNLAAKHHNPPNRRIWRIGECYGLTWLRIGDVVAVNLTEMPSGGASPARYFVTHYRHNDSSGTSELELTEANYGG